MGMDVYGKKATNETGKYFRNNCWWWRPLWNYCYEVSAGLISKEVANGGHCNDGHGLDGKKSLALAHILRDEIASGRCAAYAETYQKALDAMPDEQCDICGGTGYRAEPPVCGPGKMPCNGCNHTGKKRPWATSYPFSVENVEEFASFLESCGGFEIN